ncbi:MAG TPA: hypothetical protein VL687_03250 [Methylomirabilota bacterium]|jgi:hypothetical protein|nr:hypothetical protein [Methylomirabilota bacterium]
MTMQNLPHPDDERLAAYAGGDRDVMDDATLVAHLATCDRCRPLVDELSILRGALAELPDLAPSRPLRLIPPVPGPAATPGVGSWLRRLTAPAMAAGAGLVLVGAIGIGATSGFLSQASSAMFDNREGLQGAGAPESEATASDTALTPGVKGSPTPSSNETKGGVVDSASASEPPSARFSPDASPAGSDATEHVRGRSTDEQPWLTLLIAGAGIFVAATALRFTISPRAG